MKRKKDELENFFEPVSWVFIKWRTRFMVFWKISQTFDYTNNTESHEIYWYVLKIRNIDWDNEVEVKKNFKSLNEIADYINESF